MGCRPCKPSIPPTPPLVFVRVNGTLTPSTRCKNGISGRYQPQGTSQKNLGKILGESSGQGSISKSGEGVKQKKAGCPFPPHTPKPPHKERWKFGGAVKATRRRLLTSPLYLAEDIKEGATG